MQASKHDDSNEVLFEDNLMGVDFDEKSRPHSKWNRLMRKRKSNLR